MRPTFLAYAFLAACAHERAATDETASIDTTTLTTAPPTGPRAIVAEGHGARVELTEGPGFLVDGNAPPPAPGSTVARHDAFHGSCTGEPAGCSRAGTVVRASTTFEQAARGLEFAGFDVRAR